MMAAPLTAGMLPTKRETIVSQRSDNGRVVVMLSATVMHSVGTLLYTVSVFDGWEMVSEERGLTLDAALNLFNREVTQ